ncbi:MBL fold metallo-hydrolase [Luteimonas sp. A611]
MHGSQVDRFNAVAWLPCFVSGREFPDPREWGNSREEERVMAWLDAIDWRRAVLGCGAMVLLASAALHARAEDNPHRAIAMRIAGNEFAESAMKFCYRRKYTPPPSPVEYADSRIFDNLVFLGFGTNPNKWNAWALLTSDGIVIFDPLASDDEAERYIVRGLRSQGLDPLQIRKIVIMHGHADHYGGAPYLQELSGADIYMSKLDYQHMQELVVPPELAAARKPERVLFLDDGQTLSLGDTTISFHLTPGHTPGTLSATFPLRDGEAEHVAFYRGGSGAMGGLARMEEFLQSTLKMRTIGLDARADVFLSNHPANDLTSVRLPRLATRRSDAPHPFVIGVQGVDRVLAVAQECLIASIEDAMKEQ